MLKMLSFLQKYRIAAIVALLMMLVELAVELTQPYFIAKIIDDGIRKEELSVVWLWGGVLAASTVLAFIMGIASSFFCCPCEPWTRLRSAGKIVSQGSVLLL